MNIQELPAGERTPPLHFEHFPTVWQAVVWRNWNLAASEKLARILRTSPETIVRAAEALGLPPEDRSELGEWMHSGYITLIRRNWELLPYSQLLELLEWTPERMMFTLREDDFLWSKVGFRKPEAEEVFYRPLSPRETAETELVHGWVQKHFSALEPAMVRPFDFRKKFGRRKRRFSETDSPFSLRMVYPYSAVYGDFLLHGENDVLPDELLSDYAASGVNALWLQGVLYQLVPWTGTDGKYSEGWETRLRNLSALTHRLKQHGIRLYLYMNEPRGMPEDFFRSHPAWRGGAAAPNIDRVALCTSVPEVRDALRDGMTQLFRSVPELGGVFAITMSENLTNCYSKFHTSCPRCLKRPVHEVIAEVCNTIEEGVHRANPQAEVIAWDWGWRDWAVQAVERLNPGITLMATSETGLRTECGGVRGRIIDYSISTPGPGERAKQLWAAGRERGLKLAAKIQVNNSWEMSAIPYLPTPGLVEQHIRNLEKEGITEVMASWTLGGFPGGNLELLVRSRDEIAAGAFGDAAGDVLLAWEKMGRAFSRFPFNSSALIYNGPQNTGPMNLLFLKPTCRRATMVCFPYDDLERWRGAEHDVEPYPPELLESVFGEMSKGIREGLDILERAATKIPESGHGTYMELLTMARAFYCHFRSSYLQICFIRRREKRIAEELLPLLEEEIALAKLQTEVLRTDSRIGFEASNHYYYTENDLMEKVVNCEFLKRELEKKPSWHD